MRTKLEIGDVLCVRDVPAQGMYGGSWVYRLSRALYVVGVYCWPFGGDRHYALEGDVGAWHTPSLSGMPESVLRANAHRGLSRALAVAESIVDVAE